MADLRRYKLLCKLQSEIDALINPEFCIEEIFKYLAILTKENIIEKFLLDYHSVKYSFNDIWYLCKYFTVGEKKTAQYWNMSIDIDGKKVKKSQEDIQQDDKNDVSYWNLISLLHAKDIIKDEVLWKKFLRSLCHHLKNVCIF